MSMGYIDDYDDMNPERVTLINPWSNVPGRDSETNEIMDWTWEQIENWARVHISAQNRIEWLSRAATAHRSNNGKLLGEMIIGA